VTFLGNAAKVLYSIQKEKIYTAWTMKVLMVKEILW
jgi:hypothetical protein